MSDEFILNWEHFKPVKPHKDIRRWRKWARRLHVDDWDTDENEVRKALKHWKTKVKKKVWDAFYKMKPHYTSC